MQKEQTQYKQGTVKQIISGNCVLLTGPIDKETQLPQTKFLTLSGISAPDYNLQDKENPRQDAHGYAAREFLRQKVLGQKVDFAIEHQIKDSKDKVIGQVLVNNQDVAIELLKKGLALIRGGKSANQEKYEEAQNEAKRSNQGVWNDKNKETAKIPFKATNPVATAKEVGKVYKNCLVEDVQNVFVFFVYVPELEGLLKCSFGDIFAPPVNQNFTKKVKWVLDELISQQNVDIVVQGYDEKTQSVRVDVNKGKTDVKRELLSMGLYKLGQNAFQLQQTQQRFNELRDAQSQAEIKNLGIWKDAEKKQKTQLTGSGQFAGRLVEVHSGDSVSILNEKTNQVQRIFLISIRAPNCGREPKPWGFEAREFLRKFAVGKQVKVDVIYEKKVALKQGESDDEDDKKKKEQSMTFADVYAIDEEGREQNIAVAIVGAGLATVQPPRGEDGYSKQLDELKAAQDQAGSSKKGTHGKANQALPKFNDYSGPNQAVKAKSAYQFLKDEKKVTGVVDLVLNGSRFKVRMNESSCYGIFVLSGLKCLPNDQNIPEYQKFSNLALQFSKQNILQRDVEIELESIDKKGIFHGHIFTRGQTNFGLRLIEQGFAVTFNPVQGNKYSQQYQEAEEKAKARKDGLWSIPNLDLAVIRGYEEDSGSNTLRNLNGETKVVQATEIIDATEFYLQEVGSKTLEKITSVLSTFAPTEQNKLVAPLKRGLQCVAKFTDDQLWYRAKVVREIQQKNRDPKYEVFFVDYGNYDQVFIQSIRKVPDNISNLPVQTIRSSLSYAKGPGHNHALGLKVGEFIKDQIWGKDLTVTLDKTDGTTTYVTIYLTKEKNPEKSLNYLLIQKGYAKLDKSFTDIPQKWQQAQDAAEEERKGVWNFDDEDEEDQ